MEKLIRRGAEADIYLTEWCGRSAVRKVRSPKLYLQPDLDRRIRVFRTLREASFLKRARDAGVPTPLVYFVDHSGAQLVMQYLGGKRLKETLLAQPPDQVRMMCVEVGRGIGHLHKRHIMHSDLTTSNFIICEGGRVAFIDFGLSYISPRLEDAAVDIHLLKEVLTSAHSGVSQDVFEKVLEGYGEVLGVETLQKTISNVREIERRGRYARVT